MRGTRFDKGDAREHVTNTRASYVRYRHTGPGTLIWHTTDLAHHWSGTLVRHHWPGVYAVKAGRQLST